MNKDYRLAMRTIAELVNYRVMRRLDSVLIALLSVKSLLPPRTRTADHVRGAWLGLIALLPVFAASRLVDRAGQGVPRP